MSTFANETGTQGANGRTEAKRRWILEAVAVGVGAATMMVLWIGRRVRRPRTGVDQ